MKTLILYATKHGAAREIAKRIADRMDDTVIHDLKQGGVPAVAEFDCVIIGSSLYAGSIRKEAKSFLPQHTDELQRKTLGLFLCGMDASREKTYFDTNFTPDILNKAKTTAFLGGIFDPKKSGVLERLIMKIVANQSAYSDTVNNDRITQFIDELKA